MTQKAVRNTYDLLRSVEDATFEDLLWDLLSDHTNIHVMVQNHYKELWIGPDQSETQSKHDETLGEAEIHNQEFSTVSPALKGLVSTGKRSENEPKIAKTIFSKSEDVTGSR